MPPTYIQVTAISDDHTRGSDEELDLSVEVCSFVDDQEDQNGPWRQNGTNTLKKEDQNED